MRRGYSRFTADAFQAALQLHLCSQGTVPESPRVEADRSERAVSLAFPQTEKHCSVPCAPAVPLGTKGMSSTWEDLYRREGSDGQAEEQDRSICTGGETRDIWHQSLRSAEKLTEMAHTEEQEWHCPGALACACELSPTGSSRKEGGELGR